HGGSRRREKLERTPRRPRGVRPHGEGKQSVRRWQGCGSHRKSAARAVSRRRGAGRIRSVVAAHVADACLVKQQSPLSLAQLAGAGTTVIGTLVVGLLLGLSAARELHWEWAVPVGIILGFAAGIASMFRRLSAYM